MSVVLGRTRGAITIAALSVFFLLGLGGARAWALPDYDGDGSVPPADCNNLDPAVNPKATDKPDLNFEDTNCDGIDGDAAKAIFVDGGGGLDTRSGTREFPKKTIGNAIAAAKAAGKDVYVAAGTYSESLALASNVSIFGGYTPDFSSRTTVEPTTVTGSPEAALANGVTGVALQLLTLKGGDQATAGASSYGLRAVNNAKVALQKVTAQGGSAGNGSAGGTGTAGATGSNGTAGQSGSCSGAGSGVSGGVGPGANGGSSGGGGYAGGNGSAGAAGATPAGGPAGGSGGGGGGGSSKAAGDANADGGGAGQPGLSGTTGSNAGATKFTPELATGNGWVGSDGTTGNAGTPGSGGGGGGGGGGASSVSGLYKTGGGSGGSGGAGGGGGGGGLAGAAGGGSFGVYIFNASVVARDSTLKGGTGGNGGNGGTGASGGAGGAGRGGGGGGSCGSFAAMANAGSGGSGGNGGAGGSGGAGSGGTGGPSAAVFRSGAGSSYSRDNTTEAAGTPGTGGKVGGTGSASGNGVAEKVLVSSTAGSTVSDFDGDGVVDTSDKCPTVSGGGSADGCPVRPAKLADSDNDQIPNSADKCPNLARGANDANEDGCPDDLDSDKDGYPDLSDCAPTNPAINPGAVDIPDNGVDENCDGHDAVNLDRDGDGFDRPADCDDGNKAIHPGAVDIPGNNVDENCDGVIFDPDGDGYQPPADCDDGNAGIHPNAPDFPENGVDENCDGQDAVNLDRDGDGFQRPADCNDANPGIRPGVPDIPDNGVDENCDGSDAKTPPPPRIGATVNYNYRLAKAVTKFTSFTVKNLPAGSTVTAACKGKACGKKAPKQTVRNATGTVSLKKFRRTFKAGSVLEVRVTKAGMEGIVKQVKVRKGKPPSIVTLCLKPGSSTATACS